MEYVMAESMPFVSGSVTCLYSQEQPHGVAYKETSGIQRDHQLVEYRKVSAK